MISEQSELDKRNQIVDKWFGDGWTLGARVVKHEPAEVGREGAVRPRVLPVSFLPISPRAV